MEFKFLQLRNNIKSAFESPDIRLAFALVIIASVIFEVLSFAEITIVSIIYSIIRQLVLFLLFAVIFFIAVKIARKDVNMKQLLTAFSFVWFYLIIAAIIAGIGIFAANQSPIVQFASLAVANNFSFEETVIGMSFMQEKNIDSFSSLLESKNLSNAEKTKALQLFDTFNVNDPLIFAFFILLLISAFFFLVAFLVLPYLIVRQSFKKSIPVNILLWIILWGIALFIASNVMFLLNSFVG